MYPMIFTVHGGGMRQVEEMRQAARDARAAHGAEAELQSEQYAALAAELRRARAAAAEQLLDARVRFSAHAAAGLQQ